jgi:hypothetical protein
MREVRTGNLDGIQMVEVRALLALELDERRHPLPSM